MIHYSFTKENESHLDIPKKRYAKTGQFQILAQVAASILIIIICLVADREVCGENLYEYIDKNGDVILTDQLPPPGVKLLRSEHVPDVMEKQKLEMERERESITQKEALEEKTREKQEKIRALAEDIDRAISDVESYKRNRDSGARRSNYVRKDYWNSQIDQKMQEIEKEEEALKTLQGEP